MQSSFFKSSLMLVFVFGGCAVGANTNVNIAQNTSRELDVAAPFKFVTENFEGKFTGDPKDYSHDVVAIEDDGIVALVRGCDRREFPYELITVSRHAQNFNIHINSVPMTLEQVRDTSEATCKVIGMDAEKLRNWFESKGFEDPVDPTCLQMGQVNGLDHAVSVRRSFEFESPNGWQMMYELSFDHELASPKSSIQDQ